MFATCYIYIGGDVTISISTAPFNRWIYIHDPNLWWDKDKVENQGDGLNSSKLLMSAPNSELKFIKQEQSVFEDGNEAAWVKVSSL